MGIGFHKVVTTLRCIVGVFIIPVLLAVSTGCISVDSPQDVVNTRYERLTAGVNLSGWFWLIGNQDPTTTFRGYLTESDIEGLTSLGIDHVRLPIDTHYLWDWENSAGGLKPVYLPLITSAITMLLDHGIAVIVVPFGGFDAYVTQPERTDEVEQFWGAFAAYLHQFDPEYVFIQVANEPDADMDSWYPIQQRLFEVIRQHAPEHTMISATPLDYTTHTLGVSDVLASTVPVSDPNVIYSIHFYEPFYFTHQGADWAEPWVEQVAGIPYPANAEQIDVAAYHLQQSWQSLEYQWVPDHLRRESAEGWNADRIQQRLQPAFAWAEKHNVLLIVDEFGVYRHGGVDATDRLVWLADVRHILEEAHVGWTMWDYTGSFGLVEERATPVRQPDYATALALGLYP
jgi:hypothetical protein